MKITLSFENTTSNDVSIMVDVLRASTTITLALNNFKTIIPCFTPEEAFELKKTTNGILAGERDGKQIKGFDIGNSPQKVENYKTNKDTLILTTSNGTRILENMKSSTVLIGCLINAKYVAKSSIKLANNHIDIVMAGVKGEFALEDFLASGEIIYWITNYLKEYELNDYAKASILASRDYNSVKNSFYTCKSGKKLIKLNYKEDIECCFSKNTSENVAIYKDKKLKLIKNQ